MRGLPVNVIEREPRFLGIPAGKATPAIAAPGASNAADFSAYTEKPATRRKSIMFWKKCLRP
jgi:hypothetical protein